eukprot:SAG11_NODE_50_length_19992_cov_9.945157_20_plen_86_part_00
MVGSSSESQNVGMCFRIQCFLTGPRSGTGLQLLKAQIQAFKADEQATELIFPFALNAKGRREVRLPPAFFVCFRQPDCAHALRVV